MPARPSERIAASPLTQPTSTTAAGTSCTVPTRVIASDSAERARSDTHSSPFRYPEPSAPCENKGAVCRRFWQAGQVLGSDPKQRQLGHAALAEGVERRQVFRRRLPFGCFHVRADLLGLRRAGDDGRDRRLSKKAADRNLQQRQATRSRKLLERFKAIEGLVREDLVATREPRSFWPIDTPAVLPREQSAREREVR